MHTDCMARTQCPVHLNGDESGEVGRRSPCKENMQEGHPCSKALCWPRHSTRRHLPSPGPHTSQGQTEKQAPMQTHQGKNVTLPPLPSCPGPRRSRNAQGGRKEGQSRPHPHCAADSASCARVQGGPARSSKILKYFSLTKRFLCFVYKVLFLMLYFIYA